MKKQIMKKNSYKLQIKSTKSIFDHLRRNQVNILEKGVADIKNCFYLLIRYAERVHIW
jgi:hypothetical protein